MTARRARVTAPPTVNVGPVWSVTSNYSEEYVQAPTAEEAVAVYYQAIAAKRESDKDGVTDVREVRVVSMTVHSRLPIIVSKPDGK
jgi:hypothetical protein